MSEDAYFNVFSEDSTIKIDTESQTVVAEVSSDISSKDDEHEELVKEEKTEHDTDCQNIPSDDSAQESEQRDSDVAELANISRLEESIAAVSVNVENIKATLDRLAAYDTAVKSLNASVAANQNHEKRLYEEVEEYKKGTYLTNIKPFLLYLIEMLCEMKKSREEYRAGREEFIAENSESGYNEICGLLDFFISSFESQLRIQGVSIIPFETDSEYIAIQQRITKTIATSDDTQNGKIASVLSDCYIYDKTVLKPANVHVYKYRNTTND